MEEHCYSKQKCHNKIKKPKQNEYIHSTFDSYHMRKNALRQTRGKDDT